MLRPSQDNDSSLQEDGVIASKGRQFKSSKAAHLREFSPKQQESSAVMDHFENYDNDELEQKLLEA